MKSLVVYSSRTGNTRAIAEAIAEALPGCHLCRVEEAPEPQGYDLIALGYWVDKGMPDGKAQAYMENIHHSRVALFGTLGAWPDSPHAEDCRRQGEALLGDAARGNTVLGTFLCQGKVDPRVVEMMQKMAGDAHPMTEERQARLVEAAKHPNADDCRRARQCFADFARTVLAEEAVA